MAEEFTDEETAVLTRLDAQLEQELTEERDVTTSCFPGDTGKLALDVRKVLVRLLEGPFLSRADNPAMWELFLEHRADIISRINELFLDVEVDEDLHVAYRVNADSEGQQPFPSLMRRSQWKLWDVMVLLALRRRYEADSLLAMEGEPITALREEIAAAALELLPPSYTDVSQAQVGVDKSISDMRTHKLLHKIGDDEYRIDPMIAIVLSAAQVPLLEPWLAEYGPGPSSDQDASTDDEQEQA